MEKRKNWKICDGTNGTPDLRARFLEGVATLNEAKSIRAPSLPNIKGSFSVDPKEDEGMFCPEDMPFITSGAFSVKYHSSFYSTGTSATGHNYDIETVAFDAHASNPIYSDGATTVQPASYTVVYIMKVR